jgi:hypothetical protein
MHVTNEYQVNLAIVRTALAAYEERVNMSEVYQPLSEEGEIELYLFNIVHGWFYLLVNSIVDNDVETLKKYVAVAVGQVKGVKSEYLKTKVSELFSDRFLNYKRELKSVKESNIYLPAYFFIRLYKHPLSREPIKANESMKKFTGDSHSMLIQCFKTHVNHMWATFDMALDGQVKLKTAKVNEERFRQDDSSISVGQVLKVIGWFALLGIVLYAITS